MGRRKGRKKQHAPAQRPPDAPPPAIGEGVGRRWLLGIFLAALVYRLVCFADAYDHPLYCYPVVDAGYHDGWAQRIAAGDYLGHGPDDVFKPPLYSTFLAALYGAFGRHLELVQWVQYVLGACSCVFVAILGGRLLGPVTGRIAGLLSAVYSPYVFFESQLLTPALSIFLNLAAMLLLTPAEKAPSYRAMFTAGLLFGLSACVRPDVIAPAALMLAYVLFCHRQLPRRQLATRALCMVLGGAAIVVPISVRNHCLARQFILVSSNAGVNFYVGNSSGSDGTTAVPVGLRWERLVSRVPQEVLERPATASRWWKRAAWAEIGAAPGSALLRQGRKALAFLNRREFRNNICYHFMQRDSWPLRLSPAQFLVILPLGACGLVCLCRGHDDRQRRAFALCTLWVAAYWAVGVVFFVTARYRMPIVPFLILPAAWGLVQIVAALHQRRWTKLCGHGAVVFGVGVLCWPPWLGSPEDEWVRDYVNLGNSLAEAGDHRGCEEAHRRALGCDGDDPDAHYLLGRMLMARQPARAMEHFQAARRVIPDSPDLLLAIGQTHLALGDAAKARQTLRELLQLATTCNLWPKRAPWATAHVLLAQLEPAAAPTHWEKAWSIHPRTAAEVLFLRRRELPRVLEAFRAEAAAKPWDWYSQANYGMILLELDRADKAVSAFREAADLSPQRESLRFQLARALARAGRTEEALRVLNQLEEELPACRLRKQVSELRDHLRGLS